MDEKAWCVSAQGNGTHLAIRVAAGSYLHAVIMPPHAAAWQAKGVGAVPGCVLPLIGQPLIKLVEEPRPWVADKSVAGPCILISPTGTYILVVSRRPGERPE